MRIPRNDAPRQRMAVNFGGTVVDAERSDVAINALDDGVARYPNRSKNLQTAIDHPAERLGTEHLGHAGFVARVLMTIQQPSRMPNRQARQMQIDFIVGQHEADALMFA